jgi:hypothetical protein
MWVGDRGGVATPSPYCPVAQDIPRLTYKRKLAGISQVLQWSRLMTISGPMNRRDHRSRTRLGRWSIDSLVHATLYTRLDH